MLIQGLFCVDYLKSNLLAELHLHHLHNSEHNSDSFMFFLFHFAKHGFGLWGVIRL